jgi:hypothetical protein
VLDLIKLFEKLGIGHMTDTELRKVCRWITEGGKLFIATADDGGQKIKIVHGPLGMFVHRFEISEDELLTLKELILADMKTEAA